jgi:Zn-dependent peptidase ImmA (M78 family)
MTISNNQTITPRIVTFEDAMNLAIGRAKELVSCLIEERGHAKPPFRPEEFAKLRGIKKILKADLGNVSAVLLRFASGGVIKVNQRDNQTRQNFSCMHEIAHDILYELRLQLDTSYIQYRTANPQAPAKEVSKVRERICEAVAAELIMPEEVFGKYLSAFGVSVYSIEWLANIFRVSIRSAAWRIAEVSMEPCIFLLWQPWPRTKPKGLRLAWCAGPGRKLGGKSYYMPVHTYVRPPSTLHKAYENDRPVNSFRLFKLDTTVKRCPVESKGFGRGETRYVISLAFPDR